MKITGSLIIITIGVTLVSMSSAHPATSDGSWCDSSTPCERGTLCLGNKCLDMAVIASRYGPVPVEADVRSDSCEEGMMWLNGECIDTNSNWGFEINPEDYVDDGSDGSRPINLDIFTPRKVMRVPYNN